MSGLNDGVTRAGGISPGSGSGCGPIVEPALSSSSPGAGSLYNATAPAADPRKIGAAGAMEVTV